MKYQTLIINELAFKIYLVEKDSEYLKLEDSSLLNAGITDFHDCKIFVDKSMPISLVEKTMIHELTHAYIFAYGCCSVMNEEEVCEFVSSYMRKIKEDYKYIYDKLIVPTFY